MNTPTIKTIEELKAELAAAEKKLYEEKQELARQEREAKYEAERIEREAAEKKAMLAFENVAKAIVAELIAVGFTKATYTLPESGKFPNIHCTPDEKYVAWDVFFETSYNRDTWRSRETGTKVVVGLYGDANRYPKLKDGGYNYKKIAATAWDKYQTHLAKQKRENVQLTNQKSNEARIKRLVTQFGKPAYQGSDRNEIKNVKVSHYIWHEGCRNGRAFYRSDNNLMLAVDHITEENAAKLIQFMLDNGMINNEEK